MSKEYFIFIIFAIFAIAFMTLCITTTKVWHPAGNFMRDMEFCHSKGYDSMSLYGGYSERFGKINCMSCYNSQCQKKEFEVIKTWTNTLKEDYPNHQQGGKDEF